jgi:hypothetical protein
MVGIGFLQKSSNNLKQTKDRMNPDFGLLYIAGNADGLMQND